MSRTLANQLAISANPMRMAQFSYSLVASMISGIIPLAIRARQDSGDTQAKREMLAMFSNKMYQARDAYYASITLGMVSGCNGVALMMGYSNPGAILVRKQCEASALAVQGVYDAMMSLMVDVPFAKCICVDAAQKGANFQRYAMDNCYYFAPTHLKPTVLGLIENAAGGSAEAVLQSCVAMAQFAKDGMTSSMQPWFDAQFKSTQAMASTLDYVLSFISDDAGRWVDMSVLLHSLMNQVYDIHTFTNTHGNLTGAWTLPRTHMLQCSSRSPWTTLRRAGRRPCARPSAGLSTPRSRGS
jgi:hypothetical protein